MKKDLSSSTNLFIEQDIRPRDLAGNSTFKVIWRPGQPRSKHGWKWKDACMSEANRVTEQALGRRAHGIDVHFFNTRQLVFVWLRSGR